MCVQIRTFVFGPVNSKSRANENNEFIEKTLPIHITFQQSIGYNSYLGQK